MEDEQYCLIEPNIYQNHVATATKWRNYFRQWEKDYTKYFLFRVETKETFIEKDYIQYRFTSVSISAVKL